MKGVNENEARELSPEQQEIIRMVAIRMVFEERCSRRGLFYVLSL